LASRADPIFPPGSINVEGFRDVAQQLMDRFGLELVGSHLRISRSASDNGWLVVLYDGSKFVQSTEYDIHIVDRGWRGRCLCRRADLCPAEQVYPAGSGGVRSRGLLPQANHPW